MKVKNLIEYVRLINDRKSSEICVFNKTKEEEEIEEEELCTLNDIRNNN